MSNRSIEPVLNDMLASMLLSDVGEMSNRAAVTVTETAQEITIGANKSTMEIENTGANAIYLGGSGVLSTTGRTLNPGQAKVFSKVKDTFSFYAICAAGLTSVLRICEYA